MREAGDGRRGMGTDGQGWASSRNWREPRPWTRRGREGARGTCRGSPGGRRVREWPCEPSGGRGGRNDSRCNGKTLKGASSVTWCDSHFKDVRGEQFGRTCGWK